MGCNFGLFGANHKRGIFCLNDDAQILFYPKIKRRVNLNIFFYFNFPNSISSFNFVIFFFLK